MCASYSLEGIWLTVFANAYFNKIIFLIMHSNFLKVCAKDGWYTPEGKQCLSMQSMVYPLPLKTIEAKVKHNFIYVVYTYIFTFSNNEVRLF